MNGREPENLPHFYVAWKITLAMAADGLAVRTPEDWLGKAEDSPRESGAPVDVYWIMTYQWVKEIDSHPYVKWAREQVSKREKAGEQEHPDNVIHLENAPVV